MLRVNGGDSRVTVSKRGAGGARLEGVVEAEEVTSVNLPVNENVCLLLFDVCAVHDRRRSVFHCIVADERPRVATR